jgi:hypothetical protein
MDRVPDVFMTHHQPHHRIAILLMCFLMLTTGAICQPSRDNRKAGIDIRVSGNAEITFRLEDGTIFTDYRKESNKKAAVEPSWQYNFYPIDTTQPLIATIAFADERPVFITIEIWHDGPVSGAWGQLSNRRDQYGRFVVYANPSATAEIVMSQRDSLRLHLDVDGDGISDETRKPQPT